VNPREGYALGHRIVRRSTVYGPRYERKEDGRPDLDKGDPAVRYASEFPDGVGLMFFCCQSNIAEQFETIQGQWANARAGGADAVIAQMPQGELNKIGVNGSGIRFPYQPVVELLEGEYFFAPSISFFSKL
jgi:deferrochelatase/peroxidase EfeB